MSALPPKADISCAFGDVLRCDKKQRYSIISSARASSDCGTVSPSAFAVLRLMTSSYLVGALHGEIARLLTFEDAIDIAGRAPEHVRAIRSVGDQATIRNDNAVVIDGRQLIAGDDF